MFTSRAICLVRGEATANSGNDQFFFTNAQAPTPSIFHQAAAITVW
jgi:hypothetical protein